MSTSCVGVLGGGSWGTAIANILAENGQRALLYVKDKESREEINRDHRNTHYLPEFQLSTSLHAVDTVEEVARRCRLIVMAVPTSAFREVARELGDFVQGDQIILSASKGFELESFKRMTEILKEETCCKKVGALSGPNLAKEIMAKQPCATVVASQYREVIQAGAGAIHAERFRVYLNEDVVGVEVGGAMKNIYAIASGILGGLAFGANTEAMTVTRALAEMVRVGERVGAKASTFTGLAGMGDLIVTCGSALSRNYRVGFGLGQGKKLEEVVAALGMTAEGVRTTKAVHQFAQREGLYVPIAEGMYRVLYEQAGIGEIMAGLMTRHARYEIDDLP
jgi:glycerol-3-phosphate dehydrogenase (NAD(P)+)